ncbi:Alkaline ceramidase 3 [Cytospora mali]|uniref:Alkaline ceramidase 3 n=1 Tax=Cytospora mali TaxID=578113 RepID=A0A194UXX9_CYTMA|nr:Alkaline ceramidase 3 [Valsa mali var. pyri (nom. inval.)]
MPHHDRVYVGDPLADTGFWGVPSSKANFCEEDYAITKYVAEFINTLTNLAYVYYALKSPSRPGHRGRYFGLDFGAVSLILVGIFSFIFHATMHQDTQFLDEMSMFFLGAALLQPLYTTGFSVATKRAITTTLISVLVAVSAVYYQRKDVLIHSVSFSIMEMLIWPRVLYMIYFRGRAQLEKSRLAKQFWKATGIMVLAIVLWLIDLELCYPLRDIREFVGLPWAFVFEFHGWWHVLTAMAAARYIKLVRELCP